MQKCSGKKFQADTFAHSSESKKLHFPIIFSLITFCNLFNRFEISIKFPLNFCKKNFLFLLISVRNGSKKLKSVFIKFCNHERPLTTKLLKSLYPKNIYIFNFLKIYILLTSLQLHFYCFP